MTLVFCLVFMWGICSGALADGDDVQPSVTLLQFWPNNNTVAEATFEYHNLSSLPDVYSICLWMRLPFTECHMQIFEFCYEMTCHALRVGISSTLYFNGQKLGGLLSADSWQHGCMVVTNTSTKWISNNEIVQIGRNIIASDSGGLSKTHEAQIGTIKFGGDSNYMQLTGQIADAKLILYEATPDIQSSLSTCSLLSISESLQENTISSRNVLKSTILGSNLCEPDSPEIIRTFISSLSESSQAYAENYCEALGGRMLTVSVNDKVELRKQAAVQFGGNDQRVIKTRIKNNNNSNECFVYKITLLDNYGRLLVTNETIDCQDTIFVLTCAIPRKKKYKFYSNEVSYEMEAQVHGKQFAFVNKSCRRIVVDLTVSKTIMVNDLRYEVDGQEIMEIDYSKSNNDIVGRKFWKEHSKMESTLMTLSACKYSSMFTCNSGQCIDLSLRCNGKHDCNDYSDEGTRNGCHVMIPPPSTYLKTVCPSEHPQIDLSIETTEIENIEMATNHVLIYLELKILWKDERLAFMFLNDKKFKNLGKDDISKIWVPKISISGSYPDDDVIYNSDNGIIMNNAVQKSGDPYYENVEEYEAMIYNESSATLFKETHYTHKIMCQLQFDAFPFDSTVCTFGVKLLRSSPSCQPVWNKNHTYLQLNSSSQDISLYHISPLKFIYQADELNSNLASHIRIKYLVDRKFISYLVTTFIPCILLTALGIITLRHFRKDDFTSKITVTVSLLIVITAIYSQTLTYIPQSAAPKLIEVFFFYCMLRLSTVFVLHTFSSDEDQVSNSYDATAAKVETIEQEPYTRKMLSAFVPGKVVPMNMMKIPPKERKKPAVRVWDSALAMISTLALAMDACVAAGLVIFVVYHTIHMKQEYNK